MSEDSPKRSIYHRLRSNLVRGLAVLFPFYLTYLMLRFLIHAFSQPLSSKIKWVLQQLELETQINSQLENALVVLTSFVITLLLILFVGALAQRVIGRKIMHVLEATFERLPLVRTIYKTFRELTRIMTGDAADTYKKVVEIPLPGIPSGRLLGFVTGSMVLDNGIRYLTVFVPTAPNVTTGFLVFLKSEDVTETSLTPEEGIRMMISAGILSRRSD
ncbi:DUF502 domain-containing protein [bacterium]|nr:DUF502 domain-containing protein [candidate division CSSED10-310 bacterium]